jgi:hypothetical protein
MVEGYETAFEFFVANQQLAEPVEPTVGDLDDPAASQAPAADLMLLAFGPVAQTCIVAVVAVTTITSMNAILIAGARTT